MNKNSMETIFDINYSLEKTHTAMLKYLFEKNDEIRDRLLNYLKNAYNTGLQWKDCKIDIEMEYNSIDLVIKKNKEPWIIIEMKVDSQEGKGQLEKYFQKFPDANLYLYITLGVGEYFCNNLNLNHFKVFGLEDFIKMIKSLEIKDDIYYLDWVKSLENEVLRRDNCEASAKRKGNDMLTAFHNVRKLLGEKYEKVEIYKYGPRPDIIMNFGYKALYYEINQNLKLNIKMANDWFKKSEDEKRKKFIEDNIQHFYEIGKLFEPSSKKMYKSIDELIGTSFNTKTLFQVDICDENVNEEFFKNKDNFNLIASNLNEILDKLKPLIDKVNASSTI